ncbi:phosphatidate cytidylyltransferase [bacterium]|nr:phosphatidate cytidylyltransferase [bacterium]
MKETAIRSVTGLLFASVVIAAVVWSLGSNGVFWGVVSLVAVAEWRRPMVIKKQFASLLFAMLMVGMTAVMLLLVWDWKSGFNPAPLLTFIGMIWANDTGAYLVGKPLGKHKLMPRVSPGKSWEGLIGGVMLAGLVAWWLMGWEWAWVGVLLGVAATAGDLVESAYDRAKEILRTNKEKLVGLADSLLENEVIFKEDLLRILGKRPFASVEEIAPLASVKETPLEASSSEAIVEDTPVSTDSKGPDSEEGDGKEGTSDSASNLPSESA